MKDFVSKYIDNGAKKLILDIGCGEGELAGYIVDGFRHKSNVKYWGIDNDANFLQRAGDLIHTNGIGANFIHGSCFNKDMNNMPYNADLIIGSHVAYYATNMKAFINSMISHLSPSGAIMLMHAPQNSDQNILRTVCGAHVDVHTVSNIKLMKHFNNNIDDGYKCLLDDLKPLECNDADKVRYIIKKGTHIGTDAFKNSTSIKEYKIIAQIIESCFREIRTLDILRNIVSSNSISLSISFNSRNTSMLIK